MASPYFQSLYDEIADYHGRALFDDVLAPSLPALQKLMITLQPLRRLCSALPGTVPLDTLYTLFALSAVSDRLLCTPELPSAQYRLFFTELGFESFDAPENFSPLLCEIAQVNTRPDNTNAGQGITLEHCHWPGLRFGEMIFSRCAVEVCCRPDDHIVAGIADAGTLYFTHQRLQRTARDLSHGWGHNSRWRTRFHRNYQSGGFSFFNVDGEFDLADCASPPLRQELLEDGLSAVQATELLIHRCFVCSNKGDEEFFPYRWKIALRENYPAWPLVPEHILPFHQALRLAI